MPLKRNFFVQDILSTWMQFSAIILKFLNQNHMTICFIPDWKSKNFIWACRLFGDVWKSQKPRAFN